MRASTQYSKVFANIYNIYIYIYVYTYIYIPPFIVCRDEAMATMCARARAIAALHAALHTQCAALGASQAALHT